MIIGNLSVADGGANFSFPNVISSIDYLAVGGGGGGGVGTTWAADSGGGGGGAGGFVERTNIPITPATLYTITIGAGGTGGIVVNTDANIVTLATNGFNSSMTDLFNVTGGGAGGVYRPNTAGRTDGVAGGSGGGAGSGGSAQDQFGGAGNTPAVTPPQGYSGGRNFPDDLLGAAGGGGGAGGIGANGTSRTGGNGGIGAITTFISTTLATSLSVGQVSGGSVYFAGGGGGATGSTTTQGTGGLGGGGNARYNANVIASLPNTGGGGGGLGFGANNMTGATGGSGIVIIRVTDSVYNNSSNISVTGTVSNAVANGYKLFIFTGSGTITF